MAKKAGTTEKPQSDQATPEANGSKETEISHQEVGFGTYRGRPIVSVQMKFARRSERIDHIYDSGEDFIFVGKAEVGEHYLDPQSDGVHLTINVGVSEAYITDDPFAKKLLEKRRDEALKIEKEREAAEQLRQEEKEGITRLPIGDDDEGGDED